MTFPRSSTRNKVDAFAVAPLVVLFAILSVTVFHRGGVLTSDTLRLLDGTAALDHCLHIGQLSCGARVDYWPPLQYIPTLVVKHLGATKVGAGNDLIYLNWLSVLFVVSMLWVAGRRFGRGALAPLLVLAGLVSPLLWYGESGFGEALACAATVTLVASVVMGWSPVVSGLAFWLTISSKETALPFAVLLTAAALVAQVDTPRSRRSYVIGLAVGLVAGIATIVGLNLMRYGVPWNRWYNQAGFVVPGIGRRADYFAASLVAPNGGLVWFWPVATALIAGGGVAGLRLLRHERDRRADAAVALGVGVLLVILLCGFASWWVPFGWQAFGDRLIVPWIPALLVVLVAAVGRDIEAGFTRLVRAPVAHLTVALLVVVFGVSQFGAVADPVQPMDLFRETRDCPPVPNVFTRVIAREAAAREAVENCQHAQLWHYRPVLTDTFSSLNGTWALAAALYAAAVIALLGRAGSGAARTRALR